LRPSSCTFPNNGRNSSQGNLGGKPLQRIAHAADAFQAVVEVEKTRLGHGGLASLVSYSSDLTLPLATRQFFKVPY
jgi:hypothetical protein